MARILICGFEFSSVTGLVDELRSRHHVVGICPRMPTSWENASNMHSEADLVILDISRQPNAVELLEGLRKKGEALTISSPSFLCVSRNYHGPRLEFELEKLGARLVYIC